MSNAQAGRARARLTVYLLGVGLTAAAVGVVGWRLLVEDRTQQRQQIAERLETTADRVGVQLRDGLAGIRARVVALVGAEESTSTAALAWADELAPDALVVAFEQDGLRAWPSNRLQFSPADSDSAPDDMQEAVFAAGERLEHRDANPTAAAAVFARLSESDDPDIKAGALLRLARNLRKAGRHQDALAAYERLLDCGAVTIAGRPATLLALDGRLATWRELDDDEAAGREAGLLLERLQNANWPISSGTFEHYWAVAGEAIATTGGTPDALDADRFGVSSTVEALWTTWRAGRNPGDLATVATGPQPLIVGEQHEDGWVGFVAGSASYQLWLEEQVEPLLTRQRAGLVLLDSNGRLVAGIEPPESTAIPVARRTAAETGLPWTLHVFSADPDGELALLAGRRRLIAVGLVVMAGLVIVGGVLSVQSVRRDLRVASLKSSLMAAVSHEFRTPLTLMRQTTEALADGRIEDGETRHRYYQRQLRATARLQRLVEGVLDFGRLEAGGLELVHERLDAAAWVKDVVRSFNDELDGTAPAVQVDSQASGIAVRADREALTRALWNLLDNAVKYSPAGSPVEVSATTTVDRFTIDVCDRGPGVDPTERTAIFEKFTRGRTTAGRTQGSGLGLALAREIARAHGGDVTVDAHPGGGSIFTLSVPIGAQP